MDYVINISCNYNRLVCWLVYRGNDMLAANSTFAVSIPSTFWYISSLNLHASTPGRTKLFRSGLVATRNTNTTGVLNMNVD